MIRYRRHSVHITTLIGTEWVDSADSRTKLHTLDRRRGTESRDSGELVCVRNGCIITVAQRKIFYDLFPIPKRPNGISQSRVDLLAGLGSFAGRGRVLR